LLAYWSVRQKLNHVSSVSSVQFLRAVRTFTHCRIESPPEKSPPADNLPAKICPARRPYTLFLVISCFSVGFGVHAYSSCTFR